LSFGWLFALDFRFSTALPFLRFFSPFSHSTCTLSIVEEYLGLEGGPPWSHKNNHNSNKVFAFYLSNQTMRKNLQGYHLLWQDFPTFSQFLKWFFHHSISNKLNEERRPRKCKVFLNLLIKPNSLLLPTTNGVLVDFLSFSYLDVSIY